MSDGAVVPGHGGLRPVGRRRSRPVTVISRTLAATLSALLLLAIGYAYFNYRALDAGLGRIHLNHAGNNAVAAAPPVTGSPGATQPVVKGHAQNILIVGLDSRANMTPAEIRKYHTGSDDSLSTDSMMIVHVPSDGSRATMISIPRDSYVDIPGHPKAKINAAFADGYSYTDGAVTTKQKQQAGTDELLATVHALTGVWVDHYVQVGFIGFARIVDAIGRIPVTLCKAVDDTVAHNLSIGQSGGSGLVLSAGFHRLNSVQALEFVRQRHGLPGGDLGRVKRQQYFLRAAFEAITSAKVLLDPIKLHNLINAIKGSFYIDDGFSLSGLADQMIALSGNHITGATIPVEGSGTVPGVGSVELVDPAKVKAMVTRVLSGKSSAAGHTSAAPRPTGAPTAPSTSPATPASSCVN